MGNFLLIVPNENVAPGESVALFHRGIEVARQLKGQSVGALIQCEWAYAAAFTRWDSSGSAPARDEKSGSWLLAVGSWFHNHGFSVGEERKLLDRLLEVGLDQVVSELEGFFVILFGDGYKRRVVVITDIVGSCHCFVRRFEGVTALSGSSLLLAGLQPVRSDLIACQEFFSTGVIYEDRTFYQEVRKVPPASILKFQEGKLQEESCYWRVFDVPCETLDGGDASEKLWENLTTAARAIGRVFTSPVCDLTGGYDSRAVVAAFVGAGLKFSTTVSGSDDSRDVVVATGLARLLGIPILRLVPHPMFSADGLTQALQFTDGEYNLVEYSSILDVHRRLAQEFDVSVNGSFGEVARGFWWEVLYPEAGRYQPLDPLALARKRYATESIDAPMRGPDGRWDMVSHMAGVIDRTNAGSTPYPNTTQMDNVYLVMRMQRWQGRIASSTDQLWPCLSPFMFRSVIETMLRIKAELRRKSFIIRKMLAEFQPRAANYPLEHGYPAVPLTTSSFYKFWPLPIHYAKRALAKFKDALPDTHLSRVGNGAIITPRLQLLQDEAVREALQPAAMKSTELFGIDGLQEFLKKAQQPGFTKNEQWARLLSLEWTLSALQRMYQQQATECPRLY